MNLQFKKLNGQLGSIPLSEIEKMPTAEFLELDGRLVSVRRRKRRDIACYESNKLITVAMGKEIFRKGVGMQDQYATSATDFVKTRWHTNMPRNGTFGEGSVTVIKGIEVYIATFALRGTTYTTGAVTNPLGVAIANYDPALTEHTLLKGFEVGFYRGETLIVDGLAEEFSQGDVITGTAGAAIGAIFQNGGIPGAVDFDNPQVLISDEDFHVLVQPLHDMDFTTASGLTLVPVNVQVKLNTTEVARVFA